MDRVRNAGIAILLLSSTAAAEHDHGAPARAADEMQITTRIGALAATYRSRYFEGDYQGATAAATYARGGYEVGVAGAAYQIDRNGRTYRGFGDVLVHGAATIIERDRLAAGAHLMLMMPTGDEMEGLGMGHWMAMPAVWGTYTSAITVSGSIGYARGIGSAGAHAEHGGPLVEPMSFSEVTYDASAMYTLADGLRAGARVLGA